MNASVMNGNFKGYAGFDKEEKHMDMIRTGRYKNYGQLEDQAAGAADVEAFVFRNGEVVPANQAENSATPVIKTANAPNFGQLEDQANGMADVEAFVFRNGEVVPASQAQNSGTPVINTAPEKNYGQLEESAACGIDVEKFVFKSGPMFAEERELCHQRFQEDCRNCQSMKASDNSESTSFVFRGDEVVPWYPEHDSGEDKHIIYTNKGPISSAWCTGDGGVLCEDGVNPGYTAHGSVASEIRYISKDLYIFYDPEKESDKEILVYSDKFGPVGKVVLFDNNEIDE